MKIPTKSFSIFKKNKDNESKIKNLIYSLLIIIYVLLLIYWISRKIYEDLCASRYIYILSIYAWFRLINDTTGTRGKGADYTSHNTSIKETRSIEINSWSRHFFPRSPSLLAHAPGTIRSRGLNSNAFAPRLLFLPSDFASIKANDNFSYFLLGIDPERRKRERLRSSWINPFATRAPRCLRYRFYRDTSRFTYYYILRACNFPSLFVHIAFLLSKF